MRSYLFVADQTLGGEEVRQEARRLPRTDLPHRVRRRWGLPVTTIVTSG